jgi:BlaR1 peptidase M56/Gram-negative bacterial TonB protein C-terminal
MKTFFFYFLDICLASGVLYGYYYLFLRNSRFHQYNRFYLLGATILSLIVPLLHIDIYFTSPQDIPVIYQLLAEVRVGNAQHSVNPAFYFSWEKILRLIYLLVVVVFFIRLVMSLLLIRRLKKNHPSEKLENITFINTHENGTPFSFFRWLFWNKKISVESQDGQIIFRHELFHIQQKHSWDIIYVELLTVLFWINPFFHLIKKETRAIHEFLADQFAADQENKWEYAELLVMQTLQTRQRIVNPFFHNQIKRRIAMITNSSKTSYQYLRKVMVLPLTFFIVTVIAINCTSKDVKDVAHEKDNQTTEKLAQKSLDLQSDKDKIIKSKVDSQGMLHLQEIKEEPITDNKIFDKVEIEPAFAGGYPGWTSFLQKNLNSNVPVDKGAPEGKYTVFTQFVIDKNGKISDLKALTRFGYGMEEEVIRVMKLSPDWLPAKQNGQTVKAYRKQPITFVITSE